MNNKLSRLLSVILDTKIHGTIIKVLNEYKLEICQLSFFVTEKGLQAQSLPSENMYSHNLMPLHGLDCIYFMRCPWHLDTCPQSQQWQRGSVLFKFFYLWCSFLNECIWNQRSNGQHLLDHRKSKRVPAKHLLLLYWLHQSLWLCGSRQTVENSSRDENTRPPDLPPEKSVCRSRSNS